MALQAWIVPCQALPCRQDSPSAPALQSGHCFVPCRSRSPRMNSDSGARSVQPSCELTLCKCPFKTPSGIKLCPCCLAACSDIIWQSLPSLSCCLDSLSEMTLEQLLQLMAHVRHVEDIPGVEVQSPTATCTPLPRTAGNAWLTLKPTRHANVHLPQNSRLLAVPS